MSTTSMAPIEAAFEVLAEQEIAPLFQSYQRAGNGVRRVGEELGRSLLRWRDEYKRQGCAGEGFKALLHRLNIPRASAYRLIRRADPNLVSVETQFDLKRTVNRLSLCAKKLPDGLKDAPEETLAQLIDVQTKVKRLLDDAYHIRRIESGKRPHRRVLSISRRSHITQEQLDRATVGVIADYCGEQLCFAFAQYRIFPETLADNLARFDDYANRLHRARLSPRGTSPSLGMHEDLKTDAIKCNSVLKRS